MNKKIFLAALFYFFSLGVSSVWAQEKIIAVDVQGNRGVSTETILNQISLAPGKTFNREQVSSDIQSVFQLGFFEDVKVDKVAVPGGVKIIYQVVEKPPIQEIVIEGNQKIKTDKIREVITIRENAPPDNQKVAESKEKIRDLYVQEGYNDALIETETREKGGRSQLVFQIHENQGNVVREVNFEGNTVFSDAKLRRMVKTKKKNFLSFLTGGGKYRDDMIERDIAVITYNYLNKGYMKVQVGQPQVKYSEADKGMAVTFTIDEGSPYRIGEITFEGDVLTSKEELFKLINTMPGNLYSQQIMEQDLSKITQLYGNQGYAFSNIVPQTALNDDAKTADIKFVIDKGQKVYVERINITGNTITRDKVIRRELKIVENSLYNEELLRLSKRKLEQLGYFESVEISTPRGSRDDQVVLNLNVKEKPTGTFSVGAGYSSAESFLLNASISKNNFFGRGISGAINAEVSGKRQEFSAQYTDPYFLDTRWILSANGYRVRTSYEDFRRQAFGGSIEFGRRLFDFTSINLGYRIEDVKLDDFDLIVPQFFRENADGLTSSIIVNAARDTRDNPVTTTRGTYHSVSLEYAGNGLGGDNDYFRVIGNARYYFPVYKRTVLKFNGRIGYIKSLNDEPVPLFERFFTGGINSLRGYEFRSVGPDLTIPSSITGNDEKFVYGGNKLMVFNLEYEFPIYEAAGFRGVVFADAGNAFAENESMNPLKLRTDVGAGIRWLSPLGPLRFEWGFPINKKPGEKVSVFNFTIGSSF